jgi:hypothetical protein
MFMLLRQSRFNPSGGRRFAFPPYSLLKIKRLTFSADGAYFYRLRGNDDEIGFI